jgi:hypothetical protein
MSDLNSSSPLGSPTGSTPSQDAGSGATGMSGADQASQRNSGLVNRVKESATAQLTTQKDRATDGLGTVARVVRQSTQQLREQKHEAIASYVEQAANQIDKLSQRLRDKDVTELLTDVQRLARRQPAMFIGGAFALGLVGARFLKSSNQEQRQDHGKPYGRGQYRGEYGGSSQPNSANTAADFSRAREYQSPGIDPVGDDFTSAPGSSSRGGATQSGRGAGSGPSRSRRGNPQTERS